MALAGKTKSQWNQISNTRRLLFLLSHLYDTTSALEVLAQLHFPRLQLTQFWSAITESFTVVFFFFPVLSPSVPPAFFLCPLLRDPSRNGRNWLSGPHQNAALNKSGPEAYAVNLGLDRGVICPLEKMQQYSVQPPKWKADEASDLFIHLFTKFRK